MIGNFYECSGIYELNGFTYPYYFGTLINGIFYFLALIGLIFLSYYTYKLLRENIVR